MRQAVDLVQVLRSSRRAVRSTRPIVHPLRREGIEGFHNTRVQHSSPFQQEAAVRYLLRQGMFENVGRLWEAVSLIEELG
jgi:hypothetical protein